MKKINFIMNHNRLFSFNKNSGKTKNAKLQPLRINPILPKPQWINPPSQKLKHKP